MAAERPPIPFLFCKQGLLVPRNHADQLKATLAAENVALQRERTKSRRDNEHHQTISKSEGSTTPRFSAALTKKTKDASKSASTPKEHALTKNMAWKRK